MLININNIRFIFPEQKCKCGCVNEETPASIMGIIDNGMPLCDDCDEELSISETAVIVQELYTIKDLRKELITIGFNVRVKTYSHGPHVSYIRLSDKKKLPTILTTETLKEWMPLIIWKKRNITRLKRLKERIKYYGLI